jgi:hypothetical protein
VILQVDSAVIQVPSPSRYPVLAWTVNDGPLQSHQLRAGEDSIVLASGFDHPVIDLYLKGFSPFENRYDGNLPDNTVKITGFALDRGGRTTDASSSDPLWLNIGDSILSGDAALCHAHQGRPADDAWALSDDARAGYGYLLARHCGYRESRLAYGGYNWTGGLANLPPLDTLIDQITSTISRLHDGVLQPAPDVVLINLGENGIPRADSVTAALNRLRHRVRPDTRILVMIPVSGKARAEITQAFHAYQAATPDPQTYLLDLGPITYATADGVHPVAAGHQAIFRAALPLIHKILETPAATESP